MIVQIAPSVRASIGEGFNIAPGLPMTGQTVAALRRLGFDEVFDTQMGADMTVMEEGAEFVKRLQGGGPLPLITSCSSAWMKFAEQFYPDLLPNISTAKSPMSILGTLIKTYYAEKKGIDPEKIFNVGAMCCTAKKFEAARPEQRIEVGRYPHWGAGRGESDASGELVPSIDRVITTRELVWMIKNAGLDFSEPAAGGLRPGAGHIDRRGRDIRRDGWACGGGVSNGVLSHHRRDAGGSGRRGGAQRLGGGQDVDGAYRRYVDQYRRRARAGQRPQAAEDGAREARAISTSSR